MGQQPGGGAPRARRTQAQVRALVLQSARQLFEERGYDATTIAQIEQRSGVARTVMFRHFPDKAALREAARAPLSDADEQLAATARRDAESPGPSQLDRLLVSARELFSRQGFGNTGTRQIAEHAGVSEAALYRHFDSKADLFREAVYEPLATFIGEFAARWAQPAPSEVRETVLREYIEGLFRLLRAHSSSTMTLLAARAHETPGIAVADGQRRIFGDIIRPLEDLTKSKMTGFGYQGLDPVLSTRASVAMVLATALYKEWLFDDQDPVTDDQLIDELYSMIMHGIAHRADHPANDTMPPVPQVTTGG